MILDLKLFETYYFYIQKKKTEDGENLSIGFIKIDSGDWTIKNIWKNLFYSMIAIFGFALIAYVLVKVWQWKQSQKGVKEKMIEKAEKEEDVDNVNVQKSLKEIVSDQEENIKLRRHSMNGN